MIRRAAGGDAAERDEFARRYGPALKAYFAARWRSSPRTADVDDAVQEVFVECLRQDGALERARPELAVQGFRGYLYGVARNIAQRFERPRPLQAGVAPEAGELDPLSGMRADDPTLSRAFDRAYARAIVREAARSMRAAALRSGAEAQRRVEMLALRFEEGLPIREIAARWSVDPDWLHHEYAKARRDFHEALRCVVAFHQPDAPELIERECRALLELLSA